VVFAEGAVPWLEIIRRVLAKPATWVAEAALVSTRFGFCVVNTFRVVIIRGVLDLGIMLLERVPPALTIRAKLLEDLGV
jgi:hypothetical protein